MEKSRIRDPGRIRNTVKYRTYYDKYIYVQVTHIYAVPPHYVTFDAY